VGGVEESFEIFDDDKKGEQKVIIIIIIFRLK